MKLTQEDIVTNILSKREILQKKFENETEQMYISNPVYDLTHFIKTAPPEVSRWGDKYIFVK